MILRVDPSAATHAASAEEAWQAFANTQQRSDGFSGCVSQPAHAALAAQFAASLLPEVFGALHPEVIDTIGRHDLGWAEPDLAALECATEKRPASFLTYPPEAAVESWRRSIRKAEARSPLAGILTSRHFCLLAPCDGHPKHEAFIEQENVRRATQEAAAPFLASDLDRFTAALGFCDLLSLCVCSGLAGFIRMPLAHAADPASRHAGHVIVNLSPHILRFSEPIMIPGVSVHVDGWLFSAPGGIESYRLHWRLG